MARMASGRLFQRRGAALEMLALPGYVIVSVLSYIVYVTDAQTAAYRSNHLDVKTTARHVL